jgi:DNA polymerase alpha subunit B
LGRDNRGKIELIFNEGLSSYSAMQMDREQPRCEVALYPDYLTEGYHYMYDKLHTRAQGTYYIINLNSKVFLFGRHAAVDDRLNEMGAIIAEENEFMDAVANPGQPSQEPVKSYGRISADLTNGTTASKMSDRAVLLETSRRIGGGARVHLNFNQVPGFALFPGQVITVLHTLKY